MSSSTISFSATLPPFYQVSGYDKNFSNTNLSAVGDLSINTTKDGVTGQDQTTISSSVISNGLSYAQNDASLNGNLLTVNYISTNASNSDPDSGVAASLLNTDIHGNGVQFAAQNSLTHGDTSTVNYNTSANNNFGLNVQNAATSINTATYNGQKIVLKSLSVVGNSLTAIYELTSNLPNNLSLASSAAPVLNQATVSSTEPVAITLDNQPPTFSSKSLNNIGDLLASTNGFTTRGTLTGAMGATGQGPDLNPASTPKGLLAAALFPGINLSPDTSFHVTDFVRTGLDAFPTSASTASTAYNNAASSFTNSNDNGYSSNSQNSYGNNYSSQSSGYSSNYTSSTSAYNSVGSASGSTIRGTGYNGSA